MFLNPVRDKRHNSAGLLIDQMIDVSHSSDRAKEMISLSWLGFLLD